MTDKDLDFSKLPPDTYVSMAEMGNCQVCGQHKDLRDGSCFRCSDGVAGKKIEGGYKLWEMTNPSNEWTVMEQ